MKGSPEAIAKLLQEKPLDMWGGCVPQKTPMTYDIHYYDYYAIFGGIRNYKDPIMVCLKMLYAALKRQF